MLKYHKILGQPSNTTIAKFNHYLTLGSHSTVINLSPLLSFSLVLLNPDSRFNINKQKLKQNVCNIVIVLDGKVRIGEDVLDKNNMAIGIPNGSQAEKKQAKFLYIQVEQKSKQNKEHAVIIKQINDSQIRLSESISVKCIHISLNQQFELIPSDNKRILLWLKKGKFMVEKTQQQFQEEQSLYIQKEKIVIKFISDSQLYLFEIDNQKM